MHSTACPKYSNCITTPEKFNLPLIIDHFILILCSGFSYTAAALCMSMYIITVISACGNYVCVCMCEIVYQLCSGKSLSSMYVGKYFPQIKIGKKYSLCPTSQSPHPPSPPSQPVNIPPQFKWHVPIFAVFACDWSILALNMKDLLLKNATPIEWLTACRHYLSLSLSMCVCVRLLWKVVRKIKTDIDSRKC